MIEHEKVVWFDDGNIRCVLEIQGGRVFLHLTVKQWGRAQSRLVRAGLADMRAKLAARGFPVLEAYLPASDRKVWRMASMFGFSESARNPTWVTMAVPNA